MKTNVCYQGDCLEVMKTFNDKCIDLTVTSPPYDNLRTYNGYTFNFEEIAKELYRITKDGGLVVWVIGDQTINGNETGSSFNQALYFKEIGFNLHDTMIWKKPNIFPHDPKTNRYKQQFEYMFIFSKGKPKTFNTIEDIINESSGKIVKASGGRRINGETRNEKKIIKINNYRMRDNIWKISRRTQKGHPAPFPEQLANDHIISWSNEGDIVFDPMAGSGTTLKMAKLNNRNFIGCEVSSEYCDIIKERVGCEIIKPN